MSFRGNATRWYIVTGIVIAFFVSVTPTLSWVEFSGDSEDLLVQTVLELKHGGPWWVPNLGGKPRTRKPPLPAWLSAAAVSPATVSALNSEIARDRDAAYRRFAREVRWPALAAACLMLLAVACLADVVGGPAHVVPSVLICSTSLLFMRFVRQATPDVYLALWVTAANACLAMAIVRQRQWIGCIGGGASLGLAFMCKGPVALVFTLLPMAGCMALRKRSNGGATLLADRPRGAWAGPVLAGFVVMLAIALPWPVSLFLRRHGVASAWMAELSGEGAASISHDPPYFYLSLLPNFLPWVPLLLAGIYLTVSPARRAKRINLALVLLAVPMIALSFHHDRKERYLLPLAGPAAILAAHSAVRLKRSWPTRLTKDRWVWQSQWLVVLVLGLTFPSVGYLALRRSNGDPWFSLPVTLATLSAVAAAIILSTCRLQPRYRTSFILTGAVIMLTLQVLFMKGWSRSVSGLSEMRPIADRIRSSSGNTDGRVVYLDPAPGGKPVTLDLDIYLDQPVPVVAAPPRATSHSDATAMVLLRRPSDPEPSFVGWRTAFDLVSRQHHWYVLTPVTK